VPDSAKTEPVVEMELYFRELIHGIDSSLLEEWEKLRNPEYVAAEAADKPARPSTYDLTRDTANFQRLVRMRVHGFLQDVAARDWENAAGQVESAGGDLAVEARRIEAAFTDYFAERGRFRLDPVGRAAGNTHWDEPAEPGSQPVAQVLVDAEEHNDWEARFTVLLERSRTEARAVVRFEDVGPIGVF
jgi:hypothetical protein